HVADNNLTPAQRRALLVRRPWTKAERAVVRKGVWGRVGIAIEPILGSLVFFVLTVGMFVRATRVPETAMGSWCVGGVFAVGFLGFVAYGVGLLYTPFRALLSTAQPIFIVDGYIRTRERDASSEMDSPGYIAVLTSDEKVACEWPARAN